LSAYAAFGEALVYRAVTPERVAGAVGRVAGEHVQLGPLRAGPAGAATVVARGRIGEADVDEVAPDPLIYTVRLPVDLSLDVKVGAVARYSAAGSIPLSLRVLIDEPLAIRIVVDPVRPEHISFRIEAEGVQARLLRRAGDVDGELRRHAAAYVNEQVASPAAARYLRIDLEPWIERVWSEL
jgi:hypothetical protein